MPRTAQYKFHAWRRRHVLATMFLCALALGACAGGLNASARASDSSPNTIVSADYVMSPDDSCIVAARGNATGDVSDIHTIVFTEGKRAKDHRAVMVEPNIRSLNKDAPSSSPAAIRREAVRQ